MTDAIDHRKNVVYKAILQLTDHLRMAQEQWFRPLTDQALTDAEWGEIALSGAVNHLRYTIYTLVAATSREFVIDSLCEALKKPPEVMSEAAIKQEEAAKAARDLAYKMKEEELEHVIKTKKAIEDNLHKPKTGIIM